MIFDCVISLACILQRAEEMGNSKGSGSFSEEPTRLKVPYLTHVRAATQHTLPSFFLPLSFLRDSTYT